MDPHRLMRLCRVVRKVEPCGSFYFDNADRKKMNMLCEVLDYVKLNTSNAGTSFILLTCLIIYYT